MTFVKLTKLSDILPQIKGKKVLVRADFNVPMQDGQIIDDTRLVKSLPCLQQIMQAGGQVMVTSHLGRPIEGQSSESESLGPIATRLQALLGLPVELVKNWLTCEILPSSTDKILLLENCRFHWGEKDNHPDLGRRIAQLCDIYVNDAFATAHRKEATTYGVAEYAPIACAGPLLSAEYEAISLALEAPAKPLLAIVGGAKVSSKLAILENMADKVDGLIVGGGIANTFLLAKGYRVGKSLVQAEMVPIAERIIQKLKAKNATLLLPIDAVVSTEFSAHGNQRLVDIAEVAENEMILDLGPKSSAALDAYIGHAKTIIWNGPVGVFEWPAYAWGTQRLAQALACAQQAYTLAGGGETLAAIQQNRIADKLSYISTAGGAFLEMLEGKMLPAVEILHQRYLGQNDIFGNQ